MAGRSEVQVLFCQYLGNVHMSYPHQMGADTPQEPGPRSEGEGASEEDANNNLANTGAIPKAPKKQKLRPQPPARGAAQSTFPYCSCTNMM